MFAVFEQPDLKATFAFTVTAPDHWTVRSVSPTPAPTPAGDRDGTSTRDVVLRADPGPLLLRHGAIVSGPYVGVTDTVQSRRGPVELGVFARRSLFEYVDSDNIIDLTKQGFEFFEREFDSAYPFEKYDQIFTPEYNAGAMENAGCVTITEIYVFRGKVPEPWSSDAG